MFKDNHHLSTKFAYIILATGMALGLFFQQKNFEKDLKRNIRLENYSHCISQISSINKFNDLVYSLIETRQQELRDSQKVFNKLLTKRNKNAIKRYEKQLISVKTPEECKISFIP
jgi:hypothetical protein